MRKIFARVSNVVAFDDAMTRLHGRPEGVPGMALIYGDPGLGKTRTALWWQVQNDGVFIRPKALMTGRWLLEEIVAELGEAPMRRVPDLYRQIVSMLLERPRTLIIDEVDYLTPDGRVIETLRDIHDTTQTPMVLIGMGQADKKLMRFKHLYDRFSEVLRFRDFTEGDVKTAADQLCEVKLSSDAVRGVHQAAARFRKIVVWFYKAEAVGRANHLKEVTWEILSGVKK